MKNGGTSAIVSLYNFGPLLSNDIPVRESEHKTRLPFAASIFPQQHSSKILWSLTSDNPTIAP